MTSRFIEVSFGLLCIAGLAGCGGGSPSSTLLAQETASVNSEYVLGAGDTLSVFVYRSPELSAAELPIRPDGRLSLPLVPDIEAAGRTPTELAKHIEQRLKEYVRDPLVTVMVRSFQGPPSRQIRVIGEATQPMGMPYREGQTVLDVMIAAKGLTRYAAGNRAEIIRRERDDLPATVIPVRLSDLLKDGDMSQDIPMRPGDTLVIPQGWF
ncbi:putative polysaccharide export protein, PEP-CTERM sytem-associated [Acetobacteraceae bacterium AT-5844]|nr:putative polysaccharide export protein, PEP-CTERM sytem-associated [Acetobacteraceae bacterium AT-5844]